MTRMEQAREAAVTGVMIRLALRSTLGESFQLPAFHANHAARHLNKMLALARDPHHKETNDA